jgi:hypothetical protein
MPHRFHFFRAGGVDQVSIRDGADMLALSELNQKLWVALAMPTRGIDIDPHTLALLDHDGDGRVRIRDILAAIEWAKTAFVRPSDLLERKDSLALSALADPVLLGAAKRMLSDLGKPAATSLSVADTVAIHAAFADTVRNGDGIVIPGSTGDAELARVIADAIATVGSIADRSGKPGIDRSLAERFFAEVDARAAWLAKGRDPALAVLGAGTERAAAALAAVGAKIEDYFTRCRIAAFDARALGALAGQEPELAALAGPALTGEDERLARLPLAPIDPAVRLPLRGAINPAWAARLDAFASAAVEPILGPREALAPADVALVAERLAPYRSWLDARPATQVDDLAIEWIERLAGPELRQRLAELIAAEVALAGDYEALDAVEKAVRMQRDFGRILRNFVNFSDFYSRQDGVFQTGTLYLDARALRLCVSVEDPAKHGALAAASDACLVYCDVSRKGETRQIVAALTNGDADHVFVGRNGVFYDRAGNDWDATVAKVITNPISVRGAFWSPYKKLVNAIEENLRKRALAAEAESTAHVEGAGLDLAHADKRALAAAAAAAAAPADKTPAPEAKKIDLGTVAAIGVAIGGVGTLFGALLATLFGLGIWLPLGLLAIILMISGPAMLLAWLKLRRRNLGPILDANGWAINGRARINVAFGEAMTELARLPPGSKRSLDDPFADRKTPWKRWVIAIVLLGLGGSWYLGKLDRYLPESITSFAVLGDSAPAYRGRAAGTGAAGSGSGSGSAGAIPSPR